MDGMYGYTPAGNYNQPNDYNQMNHYSGPEDLKAARKHFSLLGGMFILGIIIIYAVQLIPSIIVPIWKPEWLWNDDILLLLSMIPMYLVGMPLLILLVKIVPAERLERRKMGVGSFMAAAVMCLAIVYISNIAGNIMTLIISMLKGSAVDNVIGDVAASSSMWLVVVLMVICAPVMEEYIFRKLIVDRTVRYGEGAAIVVSGLMFGLFHGNLNQFVYAFTLGMFLAYLYVKTGNLKITIALHMIINFIGGVVSKWLMENVDIEEYMRIVTDSMDIDVLTSYMMEHMSGLMAYTIYIIFILGVMVVGAVLLIVNLVKRRFVLNRGAVVIPKGKRFKTVILNVGMIIYCIFWIVMIIIQLFV